jgi:hypothetical protein
MRLMVFFDARYPRRAWPVLSEYIVRRANVMHTLAAIALGLWAYRGAIERYDDVVSSAAAPGGVCPAAKLSVFLH